MKETGPKAVRVEDFAKLFPTLEPGSGASEATRERTRFLGRLVLHSLGLPPLLWTVIEMDCAPYGNYPECGGELEIESIPAGDAVRWRCGECGARGLVTHASVAWRIRPVDSGRGPNTQAAARPPGSIAPPSSSASLLPAVVSPPPAASVAEPGASTPSSETLSFEALARQFDYATRIDGDYFTDAGEVWQLSATSQRVAARVGPGLHGTTVEVRESGVDFTCTCELGRDPRARCAHMWALLAEAWDQNLLKPLLGLASAPGAPAPRTGWAAALGYMEREQASAVGPLAADVMGQHDVLIWMIAAARIDPGRTLRVRWGLRRRKRDAIWSEVRVPAVSLLDVSWAPDERDRQALEAFAAHVSVDVNGRLPDRMPGGVIVPCGAAPGLIPALAATGRLFLESESSLPDPRPLTWDAADPFALTLELRKSVHDGELSTGLVLTRRGERRVLEEAPDILPGGLLVLDRTLVRVEAPHAPSWILWFCRPEALRIGMAELPDFLARVTRLKGAPRVILPPEAGFTEAAGAPRPGVEIERRSAGGKDQLVARLVFRYGETKVAAAEPADTVVAAGARVLVTRDRAAEEQLARQLGDLGLRAAVTATGEVPGLLVPQHRFESVVEDLVGRGWIVEADGRLHRPASRFSTSVRSGADWFQLDGTVEFGELSVSLAEILRALRRGRRFVRLGDGTCGMLPADWLRRLEVLDGLLDWSGDEMRFVGCQAGLVDSLVGLDTPATADAGYEAARAALAGFERIEAADPPPDFPGTLRGYQREGLGWLAFLERFGFGGCLADDMGLGKTVQLLAHLAVRKAAGRALAPALVVAPSSLVFNWHEEARRFTPELRVLVHTGSERSRDVAGLSDTDLVLTTYGTLRRDAALLAQLRFDLVVLDEAQAIKNAASQSAKAARGLSARNRLALTGTPVENHAGELVSLMEFLNPGLFGPGGRHSVSSRNGRIAPDAIEALRVSLRPFVLRRTKAAVAVDLPARVEQTLHCELQGDQRALYDDLRRHYRTALLTGRQSTHAGQEGFQVLEALLRLRQAACHPALLDPARHSAPSAKLDALLPALAEVIEAGHKALVFSQFTTFLELARTRLESERIAYEYLDGNVTDRRERVKRFQDDPAVKVFLISLRAGGVGLNLTAAEYVFVLDPWWNPAVEAQAIDRAHRIGQTRPVFAYRLVARDTVEERILEMQKEKRELADALFAEDAGPLAALTRADLERLLG